MCAYPTLNFQTCYPKHTYYFYLALLSTTGPHGFREESVLLSRVFAAHDEPFDMANLDTRSMVASVYNFFHVALCVFLHSNTLIYEG